MSKEETARKIWEDWYLRQPGITEASVSALSRGFFAGFEYGFDEGVKIGRELATISTPHKLNEVKGEVHEK